MSMFGSAMSSYAGDERRPMSGLESLRGGQRPSGRMFLDHIPEQAGRGVQTGQMPMIAQPGPRGGSAVQFPNSNIPNGLVQSNRVNNDPFGVQQSQGGLQQGGLPDEGLLQLLQLLLNG